MARVNPEILVWARETAGINVDEAVERLGIKAARGVEASSRLKSLETGDVEPTRPMLMRMAKLYRRPLLTFYLAAPPAKGDRGQDFRTLPADYSASEDALLDALVRDVRARQSMVRSVLQDDPDNEPLSFIGSMNVGDGVAAVAASIRTVLRINLDTFRSENSVDKAFSLLRTRAESSGVFVLLIGNLGSHHTAIDVDAFRGFALADKVAPFVVINDQDAKQAWSFTLLHELAHLWLGETGISGAFAESRLERFCNDVASEFLLPAEELEAFGTSDDFGTPEIQERIGEFASTRHLSSSLVAYRLYRIGHIDESTWTGLRQYFRKQWMDARTSRRERARDQEGGPNYYVVRRHRVGDALMRFVRRTMAEGELTTLKAGKVLGVQPKNVSVLLNDAPSSMRRAV